MNDWFVLDGRNVKPVPTSDDYFRWHDSVQQGPPTATVQIAADEVADVYISTVFFGTDLGFGDGPPLVFETMTFDHRPTPTCDQNIWRYATLDDAEAGHAAIVAALRAGTELPSR